MTKKLSLFFWLILLALFINAVFASSQGSSSASENGGEGSDGGSVIHVAEEQHAQGDNYSESDNDNDEDNDNGDEEGQVPLGQVGLTSLDICNQIVAEERTDLPINTILGLNAQEIIIFLESPILSRLFALRFAELFAALGEAVEFIAINDVHENFFLNFYIFSSANHSYEGFGSIPAQMIVRTIQLHSVHGKLNLNGFMDKLDKFSPFVNSNLKQVFVLPHLVDAPRLKDPKKFPGRGIAYDPEQTTNEEEINLWNMSLQLYIYKVLNNTAYARATKNALINEINEAFAFYSSIHAEPIFNYFGIPEDNENFPVFIGSKSLEGLTIDELGASAGFRNFLEVEYLILSSEDRIKYRLVIYVIMFNPSIASSPQIINNLIVKLVRDAHANDFTAAELKFFVLACFEMGYAEAAAKIFRVASGSRFCRVAEKELGSAKEAFEKIISNIQLATVSLPFLVRLPEHEILKKRLEISDEEFYKKRQLSQVNVPGSSSAAATAIPEDQMTENADNSDLIEILDFLVTDAPQTGNKRSHDGTIVTRTPFSSHFLSQDQIGSLTEPINNQVLQRTQTYTVPCPDKDFFLARMDNLMQNLDSADLGETAWNMKVAEMIKTDPGIKDVYEEHENILDAFVQQTFKIIHSVHLTPNKAFKIEFIDSPSFGNGLKQETIEIFNRAILLPKYKIFYYNPRILGFVPYPLLDPVIMGMLGFLNEFSISVDQPVCWQLAADYTKFLFYEENPLETMENLIRVIYGPLFDNIDKLVDPHVNPIDYFPTTFHSHQPLDFSDTARKNPLDLFAPLDNSKSKYTNLGIYLSEYQHALLDEIILYSEKSAKYSFEESKGEDLENLVESKMEVVDPDVESNRERYEEQMDLKQQIVDAIIAVVSEEIIEHLLVGRFNFVRYFLRAFNQYSQPFLTSTFYDQLQASHSKPFTAEEIIKGLVYKDARVDIEIVGPEGEILTPKETLERILRTFDSNLLRAFYWFSTGCLCLPIGGLDSNPIQVQIYDQLLLPSAATCFRIFKFNVQKYYIANLGALRRALLESSGYHYIEAREQRQIHASGANNMAVIMAQHAGPEHEGQIQIQPIPVFDLTNESDGESANDAEDSDAADSDDDANGTITLAN